MIYICFNFQEKIIKNGCKLCQEIKLLHDFIYNSFLDFIIVAELHGKCAPSLGDRAK